MRERATDRAAVSHLLIGDLARRGAEQAEVRPPLQVGVTRHRADLPGAVVALNAAQVADPAQVDEQLGRGKAQLHERQQRVTARQQPGVLATVLKQIGAVAIECGHLCSAVDVDTTEALEQLRG